MTKGREDTAERMKDIFALIRTRHQSGLLSVERFANGHFEEGEIHFQKGQPVDAHTGNRIGQDALAWLVMWRQVYFLFVPEASPAPTSGPRAPTMPNPRTSPPPTPSVVRRGTGTTDPLSQPSPPQQSASRATGGAYHERVPRKLANEQKVMDLALTRSQRSVYLLIDGRRTIADLIRFTSKDAQEVYNLLAELQVRGLIII